MLRKRSRTLMFISSFTVGIVLFLALLEVRIPNNIHTYFEVHPRQTWILARGNEGQIISTVIDFTSMISNSFSVVQFERGESMDFQIRSSLSSASNVVKGDTIGIIRSTRLKERIAELEWDLLIAQANLKAKSTGEKQALIDEARNKVQYSAAKVQEQEMLFQRIEDLYRKEYTSRSEYDIASWNLKHARIQNDIDKAALAALMSGSKEEELQVLQSTINSFVSELKLQKERLDNFVLSAPISGEIVREYTRDTILSVNNTTEMVLTVPLRYTQMNQLKEGDIVSFSLETFKDEMNGTIVSIAREVDNLNGIQVVYCRILLRFPQPGLLPGLIVRGKIHLPDQTIKESLISIFEH